MANNMPMNSNNINMNMGEYLCHYNQAISNNICLIWFLGDNVGQQVSNTPGQMPNNMVAQMNQMQMNMTSINNMNIPMTMPQNQLNASNLNQQMNAGQQINPNQMSQMLNRLSSVQNIVQQNASNVGNQMNQAQMVNEIAKFPLLTIVNDEQNFITNFIP